MRPPSQRLNPRDRNHQAAPPRPSGGGARGPGGDCGEPPSPLPLPPPLLPPQPVGGRRPARETAARTPRGGPLHPGEGRHRRGERSRAPSAPGRPPAHSRITRCRPGALHRRRGPQRTGGAQECAHEAARLGARLGKAVEQTVATRPLRPPRPHTDPPAADRTAPGAHDRPATRVYPGGVRRRRKGTGTGATGHPPGQRRGEQRRGPTPPVPPTPPPGLRATGAPALHTPRGRGGIPPPPEGTVTPGGERSWTRTPRTAAPPTACPCGGRDRQANRTSAQERRTGHARGRHTTTNQSSMQAAPPMTRASPMTPAKLPTQGGQRDAPRQHEPPAPRSPGHPPGGAAHGPPLPPPPARLARRRQAAAGAQGCPATKAEHMHQEGMRR